MKRIMLALLLCLPIVSFAATITNGSLTGTSGYLLVPAGWSVLSDLPSIEDQNGPHEKFNLSPDGGTFVSAAKATTQFPNGYAGIQQSVNDLIVGQQYRLSFYQSFLGTGTDNIVNFAQFVWDWNSVSSWQLYLDGVATGLFSDVLQPEVGSLPNNTWYATSITFTALSTQHSIGFSPNIVSGDNVQLGIDGISIAAVPIPPSILFTISSLLSLAGLSWRRRNTA